MTTDISMQIARCVFRLSSMRANMTLSTFCQTPHNCGVSFFRCNSSEEGCEEIEPAGQLRRTTGQCASPGVRYAGTGLDSAKTRKFVDRDSKSRPRLKDREIGIATKKKPKKEQEMTGTYRP